VRSVSSIPNEDVDAGVAFAVVGELVALPGECKDGDVDRAIVDGWTVSADDGDVEVTAISEEKLIPTGDKDLTGGMTSTGISD
jgi:hypothetical protein